MKLLDLTLLAPAENLALDEALLEAAETGELNDDVLRLWEFPAPAIVVGRSSRVAEEIHQEAARAAGIPVLRRASGGAAIVAGPGCLMYSVVLK
jgi:lipoate-protein ligase A